MKIDNKELKMKPLEYREAPKSFNVLYNNSSNKSFSAQKDRIKTIPSHKKAAQSLYSPFKKAFTRKSSA